jgi:hypothetical protein
LRGLLTRRLRRAEPLAANHGREGEEKQSYTYARILRGTKCQNLSSHNRVSEIVTKVCSQRCT